MLLIIYLLHKYLLNICIENGDKVILIGQIRKGLVHFSLKGESHEYIYFLKG